MTAMVGADIAALRAAAVLVDRKARELERIKSSIQAAMSRTAAWKGRDAERFRGDWNSSIRSTLDRSARALMLASQQLRKEADEQERTSSEGGSFARSSGGSKDGRVYGGPDGSPTPVTSEVNDAWRDLEDPQRMKVVQELANEYAERYGYEPVTVEYEQLDSGTFGYWDEKNKRMVLNVEHIGDASIMIDTVAHESRHAGQHQMIRDLRSADWWGLKTPLVKWGWIDDPWKSSEATREQVESWAHNFKPGNYADPDVHGFPAYLGQPVEVDARQAGKEGVEAMTADRVRELANR